MKYKIQFVFVALFLVGGCATSPTALSTAKDAPPDRVFLPAPQSSASLAKAVFVRDQGFLGSGVYQHIYVNGKKAASLEPGEKVELTFEPGEYIFGVRPTEPFGTTALYSIDQLLAAGKVYHYRILIDGNTFMSRLQRYMPDQPTPQ